MEKGDYKKESHTQIHPTLAVYLSGNFNDQPVNTAKHRCAYLDKLNKNKLQTSSVTGGRHCYHTILLVNKSLQIRHSSTSNYWSTYRLGNLEP